MRVNINILSFMLMIISVILFLSCTLSSSLIDYSMDVLGFHPLYLILVLMLVTIILAVIGFKDIEGWVALTRSLTTVTVSTILCIIVVFVLIIGGLMT